MAAGGSGKGTLQRERRAPSPQGIDLAAGVVALAWPGPTALVLMRIVGIWAITVGILEIAAVFHAGEQGRTRGTYILGGIVTSAFGVVVCARPRAGAITIALLLGLFSLVYCT